MDTFEKTAAQDACILLKEIIPRLKKCPVLPLGSAQPHRTEQADGSCDHDPKRSWHHGGPLCVGIEPASSGTASDEHLQPLYGGGPDISTSEEENEAQRGDAVSKGTQQKVQSPPPCPPHPIPRSHWSPCSRLLSRAEGDSKCGLDFCERAA